MIDKTPVVKVENQFTPLVREEIKRSGLTYRKVAALSGRPAQSFNDILTRNNLTERTMHEIANALNCELRLILIPKTKDRINYDDVDWAALEAERDKRRKEESDRKLVESVILP